MPLGQQWPAWDHGEVVFCCCCLFIVVYCCLFIVVWPAWDHGEVVFCCCCLLLLFVCLLLRFVVHNMSRSSVSFSFSVVLTAVPLQLDIERWVWNIV